MLQLLSYRTIDTSTRNELMLVWFVLPAQFGVAHRQNVKTDLMSERISDLQVEVTLGKAENSRDRFNADDFQVLGNEGTSKTISLTRPTPNMLSHVWPLYV